MTTRCGCTATCACAVQGDDTLTIDMTVAGVGSVSTPYVVSGNVLLDPGAEGDANLLRVGASGLEVLCSDVQACAASVVADSTYISVKSAPYNAKGDVKCMYVSVTATSDICHLLGSWPTAAGAPGYPDPLNTIAAFTVDDVGKKFSIPGGGAAGAALQGTFIAFVDATHMQMSVTAGTTVASTGGDGLNSNYPSANFGTDDTAAIQAAIDAAFAKIEAGSMAGATVLIPAGSYYVKALIAFKTGVRLIGEGLASQLWASPDCGASHVVWANNPQAVAKASAYRFGMESLSIYGQRKGGVTGRCIDTTINSEVFANFQGGGPNDSHSTFRDIYIHDAGGPEAVFFSVNVRVLTVDNLRVLNSGHNGIRVNSTDAEFHALSVGSCGNSEAGATATYALKVEGENNRFSDSKFWYPQNLNGDGVYVTAKGNWFSNCETQDNSRYGWVLDNVAACQLTGCAAGGDQIGSLLLLGPGTKFNHIDLLVNHADRWQTKAGLIIDGTGGTPANNVVEMLADPTVLDAAYKQIVQQAGGSEYSNTVRSNHLKGAMGQFVTPAAGNYAPDLSGGPLVLVLLTVNITVIQALAVATTCQIPGGTEVTFVFFQDATGGRTVAWNAVWGTGVPAISGVAGAITTVKFVNYGGNPAAPTWQHL